MTELELKIASVHADLMSNLDLDLLLQKSAISIQTLSFWQSLLSEQVAAVSAYDRLKYKKVW